MIETLRLTIVDRQLKDIPMEEFYMTLHPEIGDLDPTLGECKDPVFYSVFVKKNGRHIGMCCLYNYTGTDIELGVRIFDPECWNIGYGSETVDALCELVFGNYPAVTVVHAKTPVHNARAIRCYEKCGFTQYSRAIMDNYDMVLMARGRYNPDDNTK